MNYYGVGVKFGGTQENRMKRNRLKKAFRR